MNREKIIIIDFDGQHNQLAARRIKESHVYREIYSYKTDIETTKAMNPEGIILTGGPNSCYGEGAPTYSGELFELGTPILGLCYGAQLMMHVPGGVVTKAPVREYGRIGVTVDKNSKLFGNVSEKTICRMSHNDYTEKAADGSRIIARTPACPMAAVECVEKKLYAIQYHPEVLHTQEGFKMLPNFVYKVCGCAGDWKMDVFVENTIQAICKEVGDDRVLYALSGGVDSSVAVVMLAKAVGGQLTYAFVGHGPLRKNEGDGVEGILGPNGNHGLNFIRVNAQERFYEKLAGVIEPGAKRKIVGEEFTRVFEEEAKKVGKVDSLVRGTIYPDVAESGLGGESAAIKPHHNVGGLSDFVDLKEIIEPLRDLLKDEMRKAGSELGIPEKPVYCQSSPGPDLDVRIMGEVTVEKVKVVQDADVVYREEIAAAGLGKSIGQYPAVLTNMQSVGVMGDERTYDYAIALWAMNTTDFMTAEFAELLWELLGKVSSRIVNEVKHVNRVLHDCTGKPSAAIEFE